MRVPKECLEGDEKTLPLEYLPRESNGNKVGVSNKVKVYSWQKRKLKLGTVVPITQKTNKNFSPENERGGERGGRERKDWAKMKILFY